MAWQPINTAPRNELVLILGRYQFDLGQKDTYVLGTFTDEAWTFDWPCPPDLPPAPIPPKPGPGLPNPFIPKFWMKLPPPPEA